MLRWGGVTVDPSRPMGRRGLRWWGKWGRDSTVSTPLVGIIVGRMHERTLHCPLVPPPTYIRGLDVGG
jgi:hypothetical protein